MAGIAITERAFKGYHDDGLVFRESGIIGENHVIITSFDLASHCFHSTGNLIQMHFHLFSE